MDFADTPQLAAFRTEARSWLETNVPPPSGDDHPPGLFDERIDDPTHIAEARIWQARLAEAGWAGLTWPTEYGGRALSALHEVVWRQESSGFRLPVEIFNIGLGMGGPTVIAWGTESQKNRWLHPMLRGAEIWCQLFSEPGAGSDVASIRTRAERDGDEWVINGQKVWTSGAHYSKWGMLLCRSDPSVPKHAGLSYFIIDMEQPGVEVRPLRQMTGGANFTEVFFTDARASHTQLLGDMGSGWSVALTTLLNERLSIGAGLLGAAGVFDSLRTMFDQVAAAGQAHPLSRSDLRRRATDLYIHGQVLRYMTQRLITKVARGEVPTAEGAATKLGLTTLLSSLGNLAVDSQGALGMLGSEAALGGGRWLNFFLGYPGMKIAGGTDEILKNIVGERVLGLPGEPRIDKDIPFQLLTSGGS